MPTHAPLVAVLGALLLVARSPVPGHSPAQTWQERAWSQALGEARALAPRDVANKLRLLIVGLEASQVLWRNLPADAEPGGPGFDGHPFDLDGARPAEEVLQAGVGGSCGSYAKVLADALVRTGTPAQDVHLVDTVGESQRAGATAATIAAEAPGSGHCFLLVNDGLRGWLLVDSTAPSFDAIPFFSPRELRGRIQAPGYAGRPVHIYPARAGASGRPSFPNLLRRIEVGPDGRPVVTGPPVDIFQDLVVFRVERSVDYPSHRYADRIREIVRVVPAL